MAATSFAALAKLCEKLEATTSKLAKRALLSDFLRRLQAEEIAPAVLLLLGRIFSATDPRTLEVSWRTLQKLEERLPQTRGKTGALTILEVHRHFAAIAGAAGPGARRRKEDLLHELLARVTPGGKKYLYKIIFGEMQHGVAEGVMQQGIAEAVGVELAVVQRATMLLGDVAEVARLGLTQGKSALTTVSLQLFRPIQPMLAGLADDVAAVFEEHGGRTGLEYKYDGARVQIHCGREPAPGGSPRIKIFSRQLNEVTSSLPEVVDWVGQRIAADSFIVEGEVIPVNAAGQPLPFQELMRRFRRVHQVAETMQAVPVRLHLFDLLLVNGRSLIDASCETRWQRLAEICDPILVAARVVVDNASTAERFLQQAMAAGHEGVMAKDLASTYQPGSRGRKWLKLKPAETLDVVVVAADWGYGRRTGWLSNYHLAVRDEDTGAFVLIGRTFKGLTDAEFAEMTSRLKQLRTSETAQTVRVRPQLVVEVAYNEIQRSAQYPSQFALRFARVKRLRFDKSPDQADTLARVRQLYERQFERKGRLSREDREAFQ